MGYDHGMRLGDTVRKESSRRRLFRLVKVHGPTGRRVVESSGLSEAEGKRLLDVYQGRLSDSDRQEGYSHRLELESK
jgi:hypothetical protein